MKKDMEELDNLIAMMEEHPELFYDTSELEGMEDNEVTQKPLNEWIEELPKAKHRYGKHAQQRLLPISCHTFLLFHYAGMSCLFKVIINGKVTNFLLIIQTFQIET